MRCWLEIVVKNSGCQSLPDRPMGKIGEEGAKQARHSKRVFLLLTAHSLVSSSWSIKPSLPSTVSIPSNCLFKYQSISDTHSSCLAPPFLSWLPILHCENLNMVSQPKTPPAFGDKNDSTLVLVTVILVTALCTVLVLLRFLTRIWIVKRVGWDDWCIMFAWVRMSCSSVQNEALNAPSLDKRLGWDWSSPKPHMVMVDPRTT